jgi:cellulose synthase/poly-beta-1,6-N-acetylglucosamine synthase-like glycosyltransferase
MSIVLLILLFIYFLTILRVLIGSKNVPVFQAEKSSPIAAFSLIIPFRNEAQNLPVLLRSITALDYPTELLQILFVDDASNDESMQLLETLCRTVPFSSQILQNKRMSASPKKDAITTAMALARNEWIVTTDADCELPPQWLRIHDQFIQKNNPKMVCGPVGYPPHMDLVRSFQFLDGLSLQAVSMSGFWWNRPKLCNGANMAYLKSAFHDLHGYAGNDHIASGDDIFLLDKMKRQFPKKVYYLKHKEAIVLTQPEATWKAVISQRIRWASKTSKQKNWGTKFLGSIVFFGNLAFIASFFGLVFDSSNWYYYLGIITFKSGIDLFLLWVTSLFFEKPLNLLACLANVLIYPIIVIWTVFSSLTGNYQWKGRTFQK